MDRSWCVVHACTAGLTLLHHDGMSNMKQATDSVIVASTAGSLTAAIAQHAGRSQPLLTLCMSSYCTMPSLVL